MKGCNDLHKTAFSGIFILMLVAALVFIPHIKAQDITPVDIDVEKPEQPRLHYYDKHGNRLAEPVLFLADTDTVKNPGPSSPWPVFNGVTVGVNFFDVAMLIAKQGFASFDASVAVSIHNWFFPTLEVGVGYSNFKLIDSETVYKTKLSPYVKIGVDYNFLYKSSPDYMACIGLRVGYSHPEYSITGVNVNSGYWNQSASFSILNQSVHSCYGEALAGLRVKLWKGLGMGWTFRYHFNIKTPDASESTPWFIPGYGGSSPISATFSLFYTFGQKDAKKEHSVNP